MPGSESMAVVVVHVVNDTSDASIVLGNEQGLSGHAFWSVIGYGYAPMLRI